MGDAYLSNPTLQTERAKLRSLDELVPGALAEMRPTVNVTTSAQKQRISDSSARSGPYGLTSKTMGVQVVQPIYKGGQIQAKIRSSQNRVLSERATLMSVEQTVLLSAATAFMDIIRDQANLELTINYQKILKNRLDIENRRLRIGENTKTDVSQAGSRLAEALAQRIQAENTVRASMSDYIRIVGRDPGKLDNPAISINLPNSLDDVMEAARTYDPDVIAAQYSVTAARDDVETVDGGLLPVVEAIGSATRSWDPTITQRKVDEASLQLKMTLPLDNGSVAARARGARQTVSQMLQQAEDTQRRAVDRAVKSWNALTAIRAQIQARKAMVRSSNETLASLRTEVSIGVRTAIDLLNAEQEAFSARLSLVNAKHDEVILALTLAASVGRLTAQNLKLSVPYYDYEAHYHRVRGKIWGISLSGDPK